MKKTVVFLLAVVVLTISALAIPPDKSAKSLVCLDRKYNFLDNDNYIALKSGGEHIALIRDDNSLWMFGSNEDGKLGIGEIRNAYNAPIKVLENVAKVKANDDITVAIKKDGSAWFFGNTAESVPTKAYDNILDADYYGFPAYVDKSGNAYFEHYSNDGPERLCSGAKEIYILFNSGGDGLSVQNSGGGTVNIISTIKDYILKPPHFIEVLKSNGDLYEYAIDGNGYAAEGKLVASGVKSVETNRGAVTLDLGGGKFLTGSTTSGLREKNFPGAVKYQSGFYLKSDGTVWRESTNECVAKNAKLFGGVGGGMGVFTVHNDNSVSAYSINAKRIDYAARLRAVNGGRVYMNYDHGKVDDIKAKVREICGNETDNYINAKNISKWIGENVYYEHSNHDQSGVDAFRKGSGVCAAFSDLTTIMLTFADIPAFSCKSVIKNHAWNTALIDGVTVFIDNTGNYTDSSFDMGMFSAHITDNEDYNYCPYDLWASTEVKGAYDWDLVDRYIKPNYKYAITREEFCYIVRATIEKIKGKSIDAVIADMGKSGNSVPFNDTTDPDVCAMYKLGIINGTSATTFTPWRSITREEAAKIMRGLAVTLGENVTASAATFADGGSISAWARDSVNFVADRGIMKGRPTGFDPKNTISVQESIIICYRYLGGVIG